MRKPKLEVESQEGGTAKYMDDAFALLNFPRRPWLGEEEVRLRFIELSSQVHPDRVATSDEAGKREAQEAFTKLNQAHELLRSHKERTGHLLELVRGRAAREVGTVPERVAVYFDRVDKVCREADGLMGEREAIGSMVGRAEKYAACLELEERVTELRAGLVEATGRWVEELRNIDAGWDARSAQGLEARGWERLGEVHRALGFLNRWISQLDERRMRLLG